MTSLKLKKMDIYILLYHKKAPLSQRDGGKGCVNKFSVKPSSQYSYSFMSECEECRVQSMGP